MSKTNAETILADEPSMHEICLQFYLRHNARVQHDTLQDSVVNLERIAGVDVSVHREIQDTIDTLRVQRDRANNEITGLFNQLREAGYDGRVLNRTTNHAVYITTSAGQRFPFGAQADDPELLNFIAEQIDQL